MLEQYTDPKHRRQWDLEVDQYHSSIEVYRKKRETAYRQGIDVVEKLHPEKALMFQAIPLVERALQLFLHTPTTRRGSGRERRTQKLLGEIPSLDAAYIALDHALNGVGGTEYIQKSAIDLGKGIADHINYLAFRNNHPKYLKVLEENLKSRHHRHRRRVLTYTRHKLGIEDVAWTERDYHHVGYTLLTIIIRTTGMFEAEKVYSNGAWIYTLGATEACMAKLDGAHARLEQVNPQMLPMIVPPRPWTSLHDGGFLTNGTVQAHCFVRTRKDEILNHIEMGAYEKTLEAANQIQATPWRINRRLLEVLEVAHQEGRGMGGLPRADVKADLPPKPWANDEQFERMKAEDDPRLLRWKRRAAEAWDRWSAERSSRISLATQIEIAQRYQDEPEIFYVWFADYRTRLYPTQSCGGLNPQGNDCGKALLEFARGEPVGETGRYWLEVHGANCFGIDKVSFDERRQWVAECMELIVDSADNPLDGERFWLQADSPFKFLAWCFEYADFVRSGFDQGFVSHLSISLDGSCNGLQHLNAMLLSPNGSKVNLTPHKKPSDIYQDVADAAELLVLEDLSSEDPDRRRLARAVTGRIDRGVAKRPVMTVSYGATKRGFLEQVKDESHKRFDKDRNQSYWGTEADEWEIWPYVANTLDQALDGILGEARAAMTYIQKIARAYAADGKDFQWTTPLGMQLCQRYTKSKRVQLRTMYGTKMVKVGLREDTNKPDTRGAVNGSAPNFVHSYDASHLQLTVLMGAQEGITNWAMIHDSFGTSAGSVEAMLRILKEAFIEIYTSDVLRILYDEALRILSPKAITNLPKPLKRGALDLGLIRRAAYFFA